MNILPALLALIPIALLFWIIFNDKKKREEKSKYPFRKKIYRLPGEYAAQKARALFEKGEEGLYRVMVSSALAFGVILLTPSDPRLIATILAVPLHPFNFLSSLPSQEFCRSPQLAFRCSRRTCRRRLPHARIFA